MNVYFFGCWDQPGHYLRGDHGRYTKTDETVTMYGPPNARRHIDGTLAPRLHLSHGGIVWGGQSAPSDRRQVEYNSEEAPQGQFLRHVLDNGYTAIQWWDRYQGDGRGACNSAVLLEGVHPTEALLSALMEHFPKVLKNLTEAGVKLVEVFPGAAP